MQNIVEIYNGLLKQHADQARDIHLSSGIEVSFDDFINNYWQNLDFMILSQPDFPHAVRIGRNREIEEDIKNLMADGVEPLKALETIASTFHLHATTLAMLRRDPVKTDDLNLNSNIQQADTFKGLYEEISESSNGGKISFIDREYQKSFEISRETGMHLGNLAQAE